MKPIEAHYRILWFALDGLDPRAPMGGLSQWVDGVEVWQIPPLGPDAARIAALELIDEGCLEIHRLSRDDRWERLSDEEPRDLFADPDFPAGGKMGFHEAIYEMGVTPAGEQLYAEAHRRYGHEFERVQRMHDEEFAAFVERHPDYNEKVGKWFEATDRWVREGGRRPKPPSASYRDWPYPQPRWRFVDSLPGSRLGNLIARLYEVGAGLRNTRLRNKGPI